MDAVIGLGANVGDCAGAFVAAVTHLAAIGQVLRMSPLYRTSPVGVGAQPDYLNAAILLAYEGEPEALLANLLEVERQLGRVRIERWGPRTLDLDFLWSPGLVVSSSSLSLPHPRLSERAFALVPLLSVVPDAVDPTNGVRYATCAARLDFADVTPMFDPRWAEAMHRFESGSGSGRP